MGAMEDVLSMLDKILAPGRLSNLQEKIVRGCWEGQTYAQIAADTGYDDDYIRDVGFQLWRSLSAALDCKVSKSNFKTILRRLPELTSPALNSPDLTHPAAPPPAVDPLSAPARQDWSLAADVSHFWGRDRELATLGQWIRRDRCRLICLLGMGGIGKTVLGIRLAQTLLADFDLILWRSLKAAPPLGELLTNLLKALTPSQEAPLPSSLPEKIDLSLEILRQQRCLIILDNFDVLLESQQHCGIFQPQHAEYGFWLQTPGETYHASTLIITSREKPQDFDGLEGDRLPVRSFYLKGLDAIASQEILHHKGLTGAAPDLQQLIDHYQGHPLALKIISSTICDLFQGNISQYLQQRQGLFNGLERLLSIQMQRLSPLERDLIQWIALHPDPCPLDQIQADLLTPTPRARVLEALESLQRRSLLETHQRQGDRALLVSLQPVIMEYLLHSLIDQVFTEIQAIAPVVFLRYALVKAQIEDYLQEAQTRLVLVPLTQQLQSAFGSAIALTQHLQQVLQHLQTLPSAVIGYGGGNLLNLLRHLQVDLRGYDFSQLTIRQALLHDLSLRETNFAQVTFRDCRFANTFGGITSIAFSPDGAQFATSDTNGGVTVWSTSGLHPVAQCLGHDFWTWAVSFHPTRPLLASCGQDRTIRLWNSQTGHCQAVLQGHSSIVTHIGFSPDGQTLVSSSTDATLKQWDIQSGQCLQTLSGHEKCVWGCAFSPDGRTLYSAGEDCRIRVWNVSMGTCLREIPAHSQWIMAIALSPDGRLLATASMDQTVQIWSSQTGVCLHTFTGHEAPVVTVAFSPDGRTLASGSYDQTVRLWNTQTGKCLQRLDKHTNRLWTVQFHPQGHLLASGGDDNTARFWNPVTGETQTTLQGYSNGIFELALHPHQRLLASAHEDQTVRLWHLPAAWPSPQPVEPYATLRGHHNRVFALAFSADGEWLASGSLDRTIKLWDLKTQRCNQTLQGHRSWIWDIAFHPQVPILASASYDRTVKLWDLRQGTCLRTLEGHPGSAVSVAFSPDGQWLASGGYEQVIRLWHWETGECVRTWLAHANRVWALAFSPDGQTLATAGEDQQIMLWSVQSGAQQQILTGHEQAVLCLRFSPDGQFLWSSSGDRTVRQWAVHTGDCLQTYCGHQQWVWSLAILAKGQLLSSSQDETIRCWDCSKGQSLQTLTVPRPYAEMEIGGVTGLTLAQHQALEVLGARSRKIASPKPSLAAPR
ncbi:hypothetical protein [Lyngbya confervoides]|uniref:NB-ARC domain-containing protein n=1 Tax=Lyngbya confervoides BDU141951 TaxID=1574623 RepID=A0ABD4T660_9CYAN|nr:hypothetical protein [Lyngbya confervoides]MCM1984050.1 hypothetical protein [Lyngbya confervoides BDU141951]